MSEQPTLRALMQRCKTRHRPTTSVREPGYCDWCGFAWPCRDHSDAVAALALIEAAPRHMFTPNVGTPDEQVRTYTGYRLIRDPLSCPEVPAETRNGETT